MSTDHSTFTLADFKVGDRVKIHPASDWFMRGIQYANVVKVGRKALTVQPAGMILTFKLNVRNVLEIF